MNNQTRDYCGMAFIRDAIQRIREAEQKFDDLEWTGFSAMARQSRGILERILQNENKT